MKRLSFFDRLLGKTSEDDDGDFSDLNIDEKDMIRGVVQLDPLVEYLLGIDHRHGASLAEAVAAGGSEVDLVLKVS